MIRAPCKNIEKKHVNKSKKSVQHITYEIKYGSSLVLVTQKIQVLLETNESKIKKYKKKKKWTGLFIFLTIKAFEKIFRINPSLAIF